MAGRNGVSWIGGESNGRSMSTFDSRDFGKHKVPPVVVVGIVIIALSQSIWGFSCRNLWGLIFKTLRRTKVGNLNLGSILQYESDIDELLANHILQLSEICRHWSTIKNPRCNQTLAIPKNKGNIGRMIWAGWTGIKRESCIIMFFPTQWDNTMDFKLLCTLSYPKNSN